MIRSLRVATIDALSVEEFEATMAAGSSPLKFGLGFIVAYNIINRVGNRRRFRLSKRPRNRVRRQGNLPGNSVARMSDRLRAAITWGRATQAADFCSGLRLGPTE
jgi:hypothetical protein